MLKWYLQETIMFLYGKTSKSGSLLLAVKTGTGNGNFLNRIYKCDVNIALKLTGALNQFT